jgi:hypothetical protein
MADAFIRYAMADRIATITLARPEQRNAITGAMVIGTGAGRAFSTDMGIAMRAIVMRFDACIGFRLGAITMSKWRARGVTAPASGGWRASRWAS